MKAWIECSDGRTVEILGTLKIGRSSRNDLQIDEESVSRRHALVHHQGGSEHWLVDLGARNGTVFNARRLTQPARLQDGDAFQIGTRNLVYRCSPDTFSDQVRTTTKATVSAVRVEHRILLVGDLCGFARLSQSLSPDELASLVGTWLATCRDLVHESGGSINKYLGDGFFATWPATDAVAAEFPKLRSELVARQQGGGAVFRFVVHAGPTTVDASMVNGEETLLGATVNFVFRMEKVASREKLPRLWSREAVDLFAGRMAFSRALESEVTGFPGRHEFYLDH